MRRVWRHHALVLTVLMRFPAVHFGPDEACADIGLGMSGQIRFGPSITHRALYDGSTSPPQRRTLQR